MNYLQVKEISLAVHRGNLVAKVSFSSQDNRGGEILHIREVMQRVLELETPYVLFTGGEPLNQNMRCLIGLCYLLRRIHSRRIIVETDGSHFSQLLFLNIKHFIVCPRRETFHPHRFSRYIENASFKTLELWPTKDLSPRDFCDKRYRPMIRFVEVVFDVRDYEDMAFAVKVLNEYDLSEIKFRLRRHPDCPMPVFAEAWRDFKDTFIPYKHFCLLEG